jgi:subtilisin family serine protease
VSLKPVAERGRRAMSVIAITAAMLVATAPASAAPPTATSDLYLVQLEGSPLSQYTGDVAGIAATKPAPGAKLDPTTWNYDAYRAHLRARRADLVKKAKLDKRKTVAEYDTVVNGLAARLTGAEVARLEATPGVVKVWKNQIFKLNTVSTPKFLGLDGPGGAWGRQFGDVTHAGEGAIVGIVDSGIWPENPSFAALPEPRPDADRIAAKWHGECSPGDPTPGEAPVTCNNKLIGARHYDLGSVPRDEADFNSARDYDGHGTHTASTAAGNHDVPAVINGVEVGRASGIAPAARIAAYKVCWDIAGPEGGNCGAIEAVAAIDDAVADGVDVINYSIGGPDGTVDDILALAWFNAAAAGVFVATSAGNSGPEASTVAHNSPWNTTVAASTHDRAFTKSITLGNGATYIGAGVGPAVPSAGLVDSATAGKPGSNPTEAERCFVDTLDPAKVTGKIVLCQRGINPRTDKSLAVKNAGGVGMVLYNPAANSLNADFHFVPTVHVGPVEGAAVKAYIAGTSAATAALSAATAVQARAPEMAAFSSAGPAHAGVADLLKPDITAPGVDVIAAVSPGRNNGNNFNALSGTSMSSPHIAGIAALLRSKNPGWSPMAIKSAIMTTATTLDNTGAPIRRGTADATPLDYGAGHVRPGAAFDPGLVYESTPLDWVRYMCGIGVHHPLGDGSDICASTGEIDPSDLNYASIAVGDLAAKQTMTRTVSNATGLASVYFAKVQAPAGYSVTVTPSVLTVLPRRSASFTIELTRTTAAVGEWKFGSLTWADLRGHSVRSSLAVRGADIAATEDINVAGASGSQRLTVRAGFNGTLTARAFGAAEAAVATKRVVGATTTFDPAEPTEGTGVGKFTVEVPAGTKVARIATLDEDHIRGTELDIYVYRNGQRVATGVGGLAQRSVTLTDPGTYEVYVVTFTIPAPEQDVKLNTFLVGAGSPTFTAAPVSQPVTAGRPVAVTAGWSRLTAGKRYLGVVEYGNGTTALDRTVFLIRA